MNVKVKKNRLNYLRFSLFLFAVSILLTNIEISSLHSINALSTKSIFLIKGTLLIIFNETRDSLSSFNEIINLYIKSFLDSAPWASPYCNAGEVPDLTNCPEM